MRLLLTCVLMLSGFACLASNAEVSDETFDQIKVISQASSSYGFETGPNILYSNGPLINSEGTGIGGANESILQDLSLGLTTLGIGHQPSESARISDDFTVKADGLTIRSIEFFAYQTNEQASTITAINLRIWDGPPGQAGSSVIFGDTSTNILIDSQFSGILRVRELDSGANNIRQIAVSTVAIDVTLDTGTYWLDWQSVGSGTSGPWAPPITRVGQTVTGNAMRSLDNGITYAPVLDAGLNTAMGFPFILRGDFPPPIPVNVFNQYGLVAFLILLVICINSQYIKRYQ